MASIGMIFSQAFAKMPYVELPHVPIISRASLTVPMSPMVDSLSGLDSRRVPRTAREKARQIGTEKLSALALWVLVLVSCNSLSSTAACSRQLDRPNHGLSPCKQADAGLKA